MGNALQNSMYIIIFIKITDICRRRSLPFSCEGLNEAIWNPHLSIRQYEHYEMFLFHIYALMSQQAAEYK